MRIPSFRIIPTDSRSRSRVELDGRPFAWNRDLPYNTTAGRMADHYFDRLGLNSCSPLRDNLRDVIRAAMVDKLLMTC